MPLIKLPLSRLDEHGRWRPPAFLAAVRTVGRIEDGFLVITSEEWLSVVRQYLPRSAAGAIIPTAQQQAVRIEACAGCKWERVDPEQRYCDHPARKCAKLFPSNPAEFCSLNKWPKIPSMNTSAHRQRLVVRQKTSAARVKHLGDAIAITELRLAQLKGRHQIAVDSLQTLNQMISEHEKPAAASVETDAAAAPEGLTPPPARGDEAQVSAGGSA